MTVLRVIRGTARWLAAFPLVVSLSTPHCNVQPVRPAIDAAAAGSGSASPMPEPQPASFTEPPRPYVEKTMEVPARREPVVPPPPPEPAVPRILLPEEAVVRAIDVGRAGFVRCFKKAVYADPTTLSFKVRLHVELDASGKVTTATTDAVDPDLSNCLAHVAYRLPFPAPGKLGVVDLPLFWRPDA